MVILETRDDAVKVLDGLLSIVEKNGFATVGDLNTLAGLPVTYMDDKLAWKTMDNVGIVRVPEGWDITLPMPELIEG